MLDWCTTVVKNAPPAVRGEIQHVMWGTGAPAVSFRKNKKPLPVRQRSRTQTFGEGSHAFEQCSHQRHSIEDWALQPRLNFTLEGYDVISNFPDGTHGLPHHHNLVVDVVRDVLYTRGNVIHVFEHGHRTLGDGAYVALNVRKCFLYSDQYHDQKHTHYRDGNEREQLGYEQGRFQ